MSAPLPRSTPALGVSSRPYDAWTLANGAVEPVGSYATEAEARASVCSRVVRFGFDPKAARAFLRGELGR